MYFIEKGFQIKMQKTPIHSYEFLVIELIGRFLKEVHK